MTCERFKLTTNEPRRVTKVNIIIANIVELMLSAEAETEQCHIVCEWNQLHTSPLAIIPNNLAQQQLYRYWQCSQLAGFIQRTRQSVKHKHKKSIARREMNSRCISNIFLESSLSLIGLAVARSMDYYYFYYDFRFCFFWLQCAAMAVDSMQSKVHLSTSFFSAEMFFAADLLPLLWFYVCAI